MARATKVVHNLYRDSVSLMQLSDRLSGLAGVQRASAGMATASNLDLLREAGLLVGTVQAGPNDVLIALQGKSQAALNAALLQAEVQLRQDPGLADAESEPSLMAPRSIEMAVCADENLALISTPGEYAAAEAMKALHCGLNVMLFSDNVTLADELQLKKLARDKNLLLMGPDCGTAIINGVPLGFANVVRRGAIGCVAASGTGLQQVSCLIDQLGAGISQAIGTGSHDLHSVVGGITMLQGIKALVNDAATQVLVLISKPPSPVVAGTVLQAASRAGKPVVVCFLGADPATISGENLHAMATLEDAAYAAVALLKGRKPVQRRRVAQAVAAIRFAPAQRYVRGLYSGGTFCHEAALLLGRALGQIWSNTPQQPKDQLADVWCSQEHTVLDLGDDLFTRGRPHPMIDHRLRNERIAQEAADPQVAVILFDIVLGHGAHRDPAGQIVPVLQLARQQKASARHKVAFVGFVCGTPADPQDLRAQTEALTAAGVMLASSNAAAVRLAASLVAGRAAARSR